MVNRLAILASSVHARKGFTLIEVLIASVILFAVIATSSLVYRTAVNSSVKAEHSIYISGLLPTIVSQVEADVLKKSQANASMVEGQGVVLEASYQWRAELLAFKSAPDKFDVELGEFITPPKKYKLWQVYLTVNRGESSSEFSFKSLGWNDE